MQKLNKIMEEKHNNKIGLLKTMFSKRLKAIREENKMSQTDIANKLGCAVSTYANWEQGRREPSIYDLFNLMWAYQIEANELFEIE